MQSYGNMVEITLIKDYFIFNMKVLFAKIKFNVALIFTKNMKNAKINLNRLRFPVFRKLA